MLRILSMELEDIIPCMYHRMARTAESAVEAVRTYDVTQGFRDMGCYDCHKGLDVDCSGYMVFPSQKKGDYGED